MHLFLNLIIIMVCSFASMHLNAAETFSKKKAKNITGSDNPEFLAHYQGVFYSGFTSFRAIEISSANMKTYWTPEDFDLFLSWDRGDPVIILPSGKSKYEYKLVNLRLERAVLADKDAAKAYNMNNVIEKMYFSLRHLHVETQDGRHWKIPKNQRSRYENWTQGDILEIGYNDRHGQSNILINLCKANYVEAHLN